MQKYIILLVCLFLAALNFNLILNPLKLTTGGTQGIAILISHFTKIKPSLIILIINLLALLISYFFLTKQNTSSALISTFIYPLFIKTTSNIYIPNNSFLFIILAGIICGITNGLIYKNGFSSGGITIFNLLINKYLKIKIAIINFLTNAIIILLAFFFFGTIKTIQALLIIFISSTIIFFILKKRINYKN